MCSENSASYQCLTFKPCQGVVQICEHTKNYENTHHLRILEVVKKFRWLVFDMRVTFIEHNLSIIGAFVEHNRKIFGAVQHSIIATFLSIIGSALLVLPAVMCLQATVPRASCCYVSVGHSASCCLLLCVCM